MQVIGIAAFCSALLVINVYAGSYYDGEGVESGTQTQILLDNIQLLELAYHIVDDFNYYYAAMNETIVLVDIYNITCLQVNDYDEEVCHYDLLFGKTNCIKNITTELDDGAFVIEQENGRKKRGSKKTKASKAKTTKAPKTKTTKSKTTKASKTTAKNSQILSSGTADCNPAVAVDGSTFEVKILEADEGVTVNMTISVLGTDAHTEIIYYNYFTEYEEHSKGVFFASKM